MNALGQHFLKKVPEGAVRVMEAMLASRKVISSLEALLKREGKARVFVHANGSESIYRLAGEGRLALFYSPLPVVPKIVTENNLSAYEDGETSYHISCPATINFTRKQIFLSSCFQNLRKVLRKPREYYFVHPGKAIEAGRMIREKTSPERIISYLGLENRVITFKEIAQKTKQVYT